MTNSRIGIVLVNYNGLSDTVECIESINKSNYKNYFIIIVDNNSEDDISMLAELPNCRTLQMTENVGFGVANNVGAKLAIENGADYIFCLNNDTIISPDLLETFVTNASLQTVLTAATYHYYDKNKLWYGGGKVSPWLGTFKHKKLKQNTDVTFVCGCCMFLSADCVNSIGLFEDYYFMYYEDCDFSLKCMQEGYRIRYLADAKLWHKVGRSEKKYSGLKEYYITRNRLIVLKKYKNYFKRTALVYYYLTRYMKIALRLIKNNSFKPMLNGMRDGRDWEGNGKGYWSEMYVEKDNRD